MDITIFHGNPFAKGPDETRLRGQIRHYPHRIKVEGHGTFPSATIVASQLEQRSGAVLWKRSPAREEVLGVRGLLTQGSTETSDMVILAGCAVDGMMFKRPLGIGFNQVTVNKEEDDNIPQNSSQHS